MKIEKFKEKLKNYWYTESAKLNIPSIFSADSLINIVREFEFSQEDVSYVKGLGEYLDYAHLFTDIPLFKVHDISDRKISGYEDLLIEALIHNAIMEVLYDVFLDMTKRELAHESIKSTTYILQQAIWEMNVRFVEELYSLPNKNEVALRSTVYEELYYMMLRTSYVVLNYSPVN